jgi:hypothetical protein
LKKLPFEHNELVGFILGPNSSDERDKKMGDEIKGRRPSVTLHKASLSQNEFRIIIPHKFAHRHASAA